MCGLCCSGYIALACAEAERIGRFFKAMPELHTEGLWFVVRRKKSWTLVVVDSDQAGDHVSVGEWVLPDAVGKSLAETQHVASVHGEPLCLHARRAN